MNREKSRVTRITSREKFKFLGFAFRKYKEDVLIRVHPKSLKKAKAKLHELTRRNQGRNVRQVMEKQKLFMQGWLNYYGLADMKSTAEKLDQWLRRRYQDVHLEAMEEPPNEIPQPPKTERAGKACEDDGREQAIVLGGF